VLFDLGVTWNGLFSSCIIRINRVTTSFAMQPATV